MVIMGRDHNQPSALQLDFGNACIHKYHAELVLITNKVGNACEACLDLQLGLW